MITFLIAAGGAYGWIDIVYTAATDDPLIPIVTDAAKFVLPSINVGWGIVLWVTLSLLAFAALGYVVLTTRRPRGPQSPPPEPKPNLFDVTTSTLTHGLPLNRLPDGSYRASGVSTGFPFPVITHVGELTKVDHLTTSVEIRFMKADGLSYRTTNAITVAPLTLRVGGPAQKQFTWDTSDSGLWDLGGLPHVMGAGEILVLPRLDLKVVNANEAGALFDNCESCILLIRFAIRTDKGSPQLPDQTITLTRSDVAAALGGRFANTGDVDGAVVGGDKITYNYGSGPDPEKPLISELPDAVDVPDEPKGWLDDEYEGDIGLLDWADRFNAVATRNREFTDAMTTYQEGFATEQRAGVLNPRNLMMHSTLFATRMDEFSSALEADLEMIDKDTADGARQLRSRAARYTPLNGTETAEATEAILPVLREIMGSYRRIADAADSFRRRNIVQVVSRACTRLARVLRRDVEYFERFEQAAAAFLGVAIEHGYKPTVTEQSDPDTPTAEREPIP